MNIVDQYFIVSSRGSFSRTILLVIFIIITKPAKPAKPAIPVIPTIPVIPVIPVIAVIAAIAAIPTMSEISIMSAKSGEVIALVNMRAHSTAGEVTSGVAMTREVTALPMRPAAVNAMGAQTREARSFVLFRGPACITAQRGN
jgi:hypothetical protein